MLSEMKIREIEAKSILSKSQIYDYALNAYVGCQHNCIYCYAKFMKRFTGHREPWGDFVDVKINAPELLALADQAAHLPVVPCIAGARTGPLRAVGDGGAGKIPRAARSYRGASQQNEGAGVLCRPVLCAPRAHRFCPRPSFEKHAIALKLTTERSQAIL